jgi:PAS domain-containing protein
VTDFGIAELLVLFAAAAGSAALAFAAAAWVADRRLRVRAAQAILAEGGDRVAFLFEDEDLADATPAARAMLAAAPGGGTAWDRLAALLRARFPGLDAAVAGLAEAGRVELAAEGGGADRLVAEWRDGRVRLALHEAAEAGAPAADRQTLAALEAELALLQTAVQNGPALIWRQGAAGVTWANEAYFAAAEAHLGAARARVWPPPELIDVSALAPPEFSPPPPFRSALRDAAGAPRRWFEVHARRLGGEVLFTALPADNLVQAEEALREFVRTLSKTFADLPIGLAIFDRTRRLALFNPALTDLTGLDAVFLSARPTLYAVLDRLRDLRRMPEMRDFAAWRRKLAELESAAADGVLRETWTLPSGQTYRVTGRPHPDGALAFLFEDISAEVSLTRRFRSELEVGQAVLDSLDEAIAVIAPSGVITVSNRAYAELWGQDPGATLAEVGILEASRLWAAATEPTPLWGDVRDYVAERGERAEWSDTARLTDGRLLRCRFAPLAGGATLAAFSVEAGERVAADGARRGTRARARGRQGGRSRGDAAPRRDPPGLADVVAVDGSGAAAASAEAEVGVATRGAAPVG